MLLRLYRRRMHLFNKFEREIFVAKRGGYHYKKYSTATKTSAKHSARMRRMREKDFLQENAELVRRKAETAEFFAEKERLTKDWYNLHSRSKRRYNNDFMQFFQKHRRDLRNKQVFATAEEWAKSKPNEKPKAESKKSGALFSEKWLNGECEGIYRILPEEPLVKRKRISK